jgi:glycosyltransferase involved in cell wall biosynthesis
VLIAGTPVGMIHDLGDEGAVVVRFGDPEDVAAKIGAIARDPAAWEQKVTAAARWAETHDFSWTIDRLAAAIDQAGSAEALR